MSVADILTTSSMLERLGRGNEDTLFALADGVVKFEWRAKGRRQVSVVAVG